MEHKTQKTNLNFNGKLYDVELPVFNFKNFKIRVGTFDDLEDIAKVTFPGMAIDLTDKNFIKKATQGLVFEKTTNGFIFVVVENSEGKIVGRSYIKSWHVDYFYKPRYALRKDAVIIADASHSFNGKKILELGGVVIDENYQRIGLGSALLYARLKIIEFLHSDLHLAINALMVTNIGPLRAKDNSSKIDYDQRLVEVLKAKKLIKSANYEDVMQLTETGKVFTKEEFFSQLVGLEVRGQKYFYGAPREASYSAYNNSIRLCRGEAILHDDTQSYISPFQFKQSECIHFDHGGSYFIYNFV
ncbi:GNAT family N-acetyltransferase [Bacteriovorax sp. Seq25_V]|uniref:GNAT family N-acetyltransferase n=1 Tax=Bacteriovorax sp. Seq25_V TaxID=1201288 RepID=UPI000389F430|nr:GNAT family N-acetyltransferase [Bacteriovorax sp. Seq25_V]EQC44670.1 hypothetical protein M900_0428 [Bacteriovorax sp. Seq25_V]